MQDSIPKTRHPLRLMLGKEYFTLKRYFLWAFGKFRFARIGNRQLEYELFSHSTPLLRKLKDVEMYLQYNKIVNLKIAANKVNNVIIYPGETFSYWKLIGKPTERKGYLKGVVLQNGTFTAGTGGGLCQLSNLIYWIAVHSPLTIVERHRHGYDVFPDSNRTQPFGSGATCSYNYVDLMIKNNTDQAFQFNIEVTDTELKGTLKSNLPMEFFYVVYEKEHFMQLEHWGGYTRHNFLYRKKYNLEDDLIGDEYVAENHAVMMYAPFLAQSSGRTE